MEVNYIKTLCYKTGIFIFISIIEVLLLELLVPYQRFPPFLEKVAGLFYILFTYGVTQWLYYKIQVKMTEREEDKLNGIIKVDKKYNLESIRLCLIISYLLYILYEFLLIPIEISWRYQSIHYLPYKIHYSIVLPKLVIVAVVLMLIYFIMRYRQSSRITK